MLAHPGSVKATATEAAVAVASVELASSVHFFFADQCPGAKNRLGLGGLFPNKGISLINRRTLDGG